MQFKNYCQSFLPCTHAFHSIFDTDGKALLANMQTKTVFHKFNFKAKVYDIKFSPDGKSVFLYATFAINYRC